MQRLRALLLAPALAAVAVAYAQAPSGRLTLTPVGGYGNGGFDEAAAESGDSRSDAKGPEPEGLAVGEIDGVPYVFVGLERVGGVMAWDLSDRSDPELVAYRNDRPFFAAADGDDAGDLGPEGLVFVPAADAPGGVPLLIVAHEITGITRVYEIAVR